MGFGIRCGTKGIGLVISISGLISACGPNIFSKDAVSKKVVGSCANRISVAYVGTPEKAYCTARPTYLSGVTITGSATYQARSYTATGLSDTINVNAPIRFAEVVAYDPTGSISQCAETDVNGNFSLLLPTSTDVYKVSIYSRGKNSAVNASVMNCPEENRPYSVEAEFTPDSNQSIGPLVAKSENTGPLVGAAFNIFDQIVKANEFLRAQAGSCTIPGCSSFTVAPAVQIYWDKGFNPNAYYGDPSGVSFYIPNYDRLFILGGSEGDIYDSDTDHFDNSVILHEYGHFLEDAYSISDNPGGQHFGDSIIDPRLAWSEGWGNFIQAAIRGEARYRDTAGTYNVSQPSSYSYYFLNIPLERASNSCNTNPDDSGCDIPTLDYEGNFREFAVTRMLWDVFDSNALNTDGDSVHNAFQEVWYSLTSNLAFLDSNLAFRNIGFLHLFQSSEIFGASDWSSLRSEHKQGDTLEYANHIAGGQCGKVYQLDPYTDQNDNGSFATSHLLRNNNFHHYKHPGGPIQLVLKATTVDLSGGYLTEREPDLDLILYKEEARIGESHDMAGSAANYWDNDPSTGDQTETITLSHLPAGHYLINVKVDTARYALDDNFATNNCVGTGFRRICENDPAPDFNYIPAGDDIAYELRLNGVNLCPADLP